MDAYLDGLTAVFGWVLQSSWQGALLVVLIVAVQAGLRGRLSPPWRHALWGLLIVRLVLVWAPTAPWSLYNVTSPELPVSRYLAPVAVVGEPPPVTNPTLAEPALEGAGRATDVRDINDLNDTDGGAVRAGGAITADRTHGSNGLVAGVELGRWEIAGLLWVGVAGLFLGAMLYQTYRFGRQIRAGRLVTDSATLELLEECRTRLGLSTYLALVETDCVRSPALLGCIRPKLLLPRGFLNALSREEMRYVFLHELAHVKRGDIWSSWLINLLTAAHWFNPLIWYARRRFIADREAACDAHVLAALDEFGQRAYGHTLLNLMQRFNATQWAPGIAGISENNSNLKRRILMIKHFRSPTRLAAWVGVSLCVILGLVTLTNAQVNANAGVDIVCTPADIYGYTASNGGTMIAAQLTNSGPSELMVEVEFWEGTPGPGKKIGRGGLAIPAGKTATEAIPWVVGNGSHPITVWIDPDNQIEETDEANNAFQVTIGYEDGRFTRESEPTASLGRMGSREGRSTGRTPLSVAPPVGRAAPSLNPVTAAIREAFSHEAELRAECQNNLKQLGLVFKMFANESEGQRWPVLSREPGRLMFAWGGNEHQLDGMPVLSHEYMSQLSIAACAKTEDAPELPDDTDYVYLGHVVRSDEDVRHFAEAYRNWAVRSGVGSKIWFSDDIQLPLQEKRDVPGPNSLFRIREGIERFYITDINDPASAGRQQSYTPVVIEWPDRHRSSSGKQGGNVLFMDGHVEFMTYPGEWPMTEETIGILAELAGREPVETAEREEAQRNVDAAEMAEPDARDLEEVNDDKLWPLAFWKSGIMEQKPGAVEEAMLRATEAQLSAREREVLEAYVLELKTVGDSSRRPPSEKASDPAAELRAQCQNNMKQLGVVFKMFAYESKDGVWAPLSREPGRLMFAWGGTEPTLGGMAVMSHEYMSQVSIAVCPRTEDAPEIPDDTDYAYLGHLIRNEDDLLRFAEAYKEWAQSGGDEAKWFADDTPRSPDTGIVRLREGIERFLITDFNNPAGAMLAQAQIPVLIEWPDHHPTEHGKQGGNVLYMDGHVEFVTYPGKWPMTVETIGILAELAGRESVGG